MAKKVAAKKIAYPHVSPFANQLNNAQSSAYAAQLQQSHTHSASYTSTAISTFGDIGLIGYTNGKPDKIEIFGTRITEEEFDKINSSNSILLQFDGETFRVDGKEIFIDDLSSLGETLVAIFARRNLLNE